MTYEPDPDALAVEWLDDRALLSAQEECCQARCAWAQVAPEGGALASGATPLQCLLYARMKTSEFVYEMARMRAEREVSAL